MGTLHEDSYKCMIVSRSVIFKMSNLWDKIYRENQNAYLIRIFLRKSCHLWDNVEKYCRAWQPDDSMAHVNLMLDT